MRFHDKDNTGKVVELYFHCGLFKKIYKRLLFYIHDSICILLQKNSNVLKTESRVIIMIII